MMKFRHILYIGLTVAFALLLSGCKQFAVLNPKGIIAASEMRLLIDATLLMLIVVIPVIILTLVIIWKYRASNKNAKYTPDKAHSNILEAICWAVPGIIIVILATITWVSSHKLDPYRPLDTKSKPLVIQAVALDWRWMFIYPAQHIATINYVQIPVHKQIKFMITADAPMNSLEIPQLAGQIYAMTGMQSKLHLMANEAGTYRGLSTNYSGDGFANMVFWVHAGTEQQFNQWVKSVQKSPRKLTIATYNQVAKPTTDSSAKYFSAPAKNLFNKIIMKYMMPPSKTPMMDHDTMMTHDAK